ncbi:MAG: glycosyl hydrolase, partial [Acidimicrobiales bacterium]
GIENVNRYSAWIGRDVDLAQDFVPAENRPGVAGWDQFHPAGDGSHWMLDAWRDWMAARPGRNLVLTVPMLVPYSPGSGGRPWEAGRADRERIAAELRRGAAGEFDDHFEALAEALVARGMNRVKLRIGHEAHGDWYRHQYGPDPEAWKAYFRRIVGVLRAVPGQAFEVNWNLGPGASTRDIDGTIVPPDRAWPGDDVVDSIGLDVYWSATTWDAIRRGEGLVQGADGAGYGLDWAARFAAERGKPLTIPEWGCWNPETCRDDDGTASRFIQHMYDWMKANEVAWHVYHDVNHRADSAGAPTDHRLSTPTNYPEASALYRRLFGAPTR